MTNNKINLKQTINELQGNGGTSIPVDINTAVSVEGVERGDNFVDVFLKDEFGRTKKDRIYDPSREYVNRLTLKEGQTRDELFQAEEETATKKLLQYVLAATDAEIPDELNYKGVVDLTVKALANPKHKINLKLVPSRKDPRWSDFPRFAPYAERYREGMPPTLKYSKYERTLLEPREDANTTNEGETYTLF